MLHLVLESTFLDKIDHAIFALDCFAVWGIFLPPPLRLRNLDVDLMVNHLTDSFLAASQSSKSLRKIAVEFSDSLKGRGKFGSFFANRQNDGMLIWIYAAACLGRSTAGVIVVIACPIKFVLRLESHDSRLFTLKRAFILPVKWTNTRNMVRGHRGRLFFYSPSIVWIRYSFVQSPEKPIKKALKLSAYE